MSGTHLAAIAEAVESIQIHRDGSYSWCGKREGQIPRQARVNLTSRNSADYLAYQLSAVLYERFYLTGLATVRIRSLPPMHRSDDEFVAILSEHNPSIGQWQSGWTVVQIAPELILERNGLKFNVDTEEIKSIADYIGGKEVPVPDYSVDQKVYARIPSEHRKLSPGFFLVVGSKDDSSLMRDGCVRFYWNLRARAAPAFLKAVSEALNGIDVAFRAKVLDNSALYHRCDAGVAYVGTSDVPKAAPVLRGVYEDVAHALSPEVPAMTKQLSPGVAVAEDPGDGSSFGQSRCELIAHALVDAYNTGCDGNAAKMAKVRDAFGGAGVDLDTPYLNAGSTGLNVEW
jgi:hypothetical protein